MAVCVRRIHIYAVDLPSTPSISHPRYTTFLSLSTTWYITSTPTSPPPRVRVLCFSWQVTVLHGPFVFHRYFFIACTSAEAVKAVFYLFIFLQPWHVPERMSPRIAAPELGRDRGERGRVKSFVFFPPKIPSPLHVLMLSLRWPCSLSGFVGVLWR